MDETMFKRYELNQFVMLNTLDLRVIFMIMNVEVNKLNMNMDESLKSEESKSCWRVNWEEKEKNLEFGKSLIEFGEVGSMKCLKEEPEVELESD